MGTSNIISGFTNNPRFDFGIYANGYHNSAKLLAIDFLSKSGYKDNDGYPIVFLYRHAFELSLKNIIYWGVRLSNFKNVEKIDLILYNHHRLDNLASIVKGILLNLFPVDSELELIVENIIKVSIEFTDLDKDSYSYRYPIDKKGNRSTKQHQAINISSFNETMDNLLNSMNTINFGLELETSRAFEINNILSKYIEE